MNSKLRMKFDVPFRSLSLMVSRLIQHRQACQHSSECFNSFPYTKLLLENNFSSMNINWSSSINMLHVLIVIMPRWNGKAKFHGLKPLWWRSYFFAGRSEEREWWNKHVKLTRLATSSLCAFRLVWDNKKTLLPQPEAEKMIFSGSSGRKDKWKEQVWILNTCSVFSLK